MASTSASEPGVFGAGLSVGLGYTFDPVEFFKRPATILRLVSWLFSIVVFGCIGNGCYVEDYCIMRMDKNACGFGIFVGSVAFVACIGFLILDALFEQLSSAQHRKYAVLADIAFSSTWTFFYFVAFCYLTNRLTNTPEAIFIVLSVQPWQINNARASVAFSFFSIGTFAALIFFAVLKFRQGQQNAFPPSSQIESQVAAASADGSYQVGGGAALPRADSGFQQPPFTGGANSGDTTDQYQPPTY